MKTIEEAANEFANKQVIYTNRAELEKGFKAGVEFAQNSYTTELINVEDFGYPEQMVKCCGIGVITNENYCPNCGRKIIKN